MLFFPRNPNKLTFPLAIIAGCLVLILSSQYSFILFHFLVEMFTIVIAFGIFVVAWSSRRYIKNNFLLILGIGYFFIGAIDLIHSLSYKGIEIFTGYTTNLPTQLWISARYLEALTFLAALLFLNKAKAHPSPMPSSRNTKTKSNLVFAGYSIIFGLLLLSVFYWQNFPAAYLEETGLTTFKKISEYVISFILLVSIVILFKKKKRLDSKMVNLLSLTLMTKIVSELFFTEYAGVYDFSNMFGHIFKFISFLLMYKAVLEIGLMEPYRFLFLDLKKSQEEYNAAQSELQKRIEEHLAEAYEHLGIANRKISLLLEMDKHSRQKKKNREAIIAYILEIAKGASHAKIALLYRYEGNDRFSLISEQDADKDSLKNLRKVYLERAGFLKELMQNKKRINSPCKTADPGCFNHKNNLSYFVALPLIHEKLLGGFLFLGFDRRTSMGTQELEFLDIFSIHAANALSRLKVIKAAAAE